MIVGAQASLTGDASSAEAPVVGAQARANQPGKHETKPVPQGEGRHEILGVSVGSELRGSQAFVGIQPLDLSTSVGNSPIQIVVDKGGETVGNSTLDAIASQVSLRTWPELEVVPVQVVLQDVISAVPLRRTSATIELRPLNPLSDRWYAVQGPAWLRGARWHPLLDSLDRDATRTVRFKVGRELLVTGVRIYRKDDGANVLYVDFSEQVAGDAGALTFDGQTCESERLGPGQSTNAVALRCAGGLLPGAGVSVTIGEGLSTLDGAKIAKRTIRFNDDAAVQVGPRGRRIKAEL